MIPEVFRNGIAVFAVVGGMTQEILIVRGMIRSARARRAMHMPAGPLWTRSEYEGLLWSAVSLTAGLVIAGYGLYMNTAVQGTFILLCLVFMVLLRVSRKRSRHA